jgi:hypothetical protein
LELFYQNDGSRKGVWLRIEIGEGEKRTTERTERGNLTSTNDGNET